MGWRDRDYAKFRKDEFDAIYGASGRSPSPQPRVRASTGPRTNVPVGGVPRALKLLAVSVVGAAALLAVGIAAGRIGRMSSLGSHAPSGSPMVVPQSPARPVRRGSHRVTRINGTRLLRYGSTLTLSDRHTPMSGAIVVSGRWGSGRWTTFAVARGEAHKFSFRIPLTRRGVLHLRIAYPDGHRAVGT
jgi:hypothetical protein